MPRLRKIALLAIIFASGVILLLYDPLLTAYSASTKTPRNWTKRSSPMRADLVYVWDHWEDENLKNSAAVIALSKYMEEQLNRESTVEDLRLHISQHFDSPDFSDASGALPGSAWKQRVRGYPEYLMDSQKILTVTYFHRDGKFVYAKLRMDRSKSSEDLRTINLTPWVDLFDLLPKPNGEQTPEDF